jgi:hypothetical protein
MPHIEGPIRFPRPNIALDELHRGSSRSQTTAHRIERTATDVHDRHVGEPTLDERVDRRDVVTPPASD